MNPFASEQNPDRSQEPEKSHSMDITPNSFASSSKDVRLTSNPPNRDFPAWPAKLEQIIALAKDLGLTEEEFLKGLQARKPNQIPIIQPPNLSTDPSVREPLPSQGSSVGEPLPPAVSRTGLDSFNRFRVPIKSQEITTPSLNELGQRVYEMFPEGAITIDQANELANEAQESAIKRLQNIRSWQSFEKKDPVIVDLIELEKFKASLEKKINRVTELLEQGQEDSPNAMGNYLKAAELSCEMFREISDSQVFSDSINRLAWARSQHEAEFIKLMQDVSGELKNFIQKERDLLKKHNVPMRDRILDEGLEALEYIKQGKDAPRTPINESLKTLREKTCELYVKMEKSTSDSKKREQVKKVLVKAIMAGSGCVVAIVNVMAEQDGTFTPVEAALSGHMAAGIIGVAAVDVVNFMVSLAG